MAALTVDADIGAAFTSDRLGLVYWRGTAGRRTLYYMNFATRQARPVTGEAALAAAVSARTGTPIDPATIDADDLELDYDAAKGLLHVTLADRDWTMGPDGSVAEKPVAPPLVSPDDRFEIVFRNYNLVARDRRSGREVALTSDGTRDRPYGRRVAKLPEILRADSEEPDLPVAALWSPGSRHILTSRLDARDVPRLSITQQTPPGEFYPRSFRYLYPLAGSPHLPQVERLTVDVVQAMKSGRSKPVRLAIPNEALLYPDNPSQDWQGGRVRATWTERGYGQVVVYDADPDTGAARIVAREHATPLVFVTSSFFHPAPELGGELNVSERTGWAQLYLVRPDDPDGGMPLTRGEREVIGVEHVDSTAVLVTGVGREPGHDPYDRALYRVAPDGSATTLLTPEPLDHDVTVSPDGKWFVDAMSSPAMPTRTVLRDARDGMIVLDLARADAGALVAAGYTMPEPFVGLAADGKTMLRAMIYRPARFDPKRHYPVIDNVYTGPTTTQVPTGWAKAIRSSSSSVAQIGTIVVQIDGRGTSRRGKAFRLPSYQNLGEVGLDDHIAMIRQIAARYPQLDISRVGVYGGSAGGYDAARFVLRRPSFFKVAVAWAGNHDLRLDKAWWPEASMGNADAATWERNSNMSVAKNLTGHLLLVHGDIDDNVPVTESLRLAKTLIDAGRDVDLVILPNTRHRVYRPFFWRKLRAYFTQYLLDETPPPSGAGDPR